MRNKLAIVALAAIGCLLVPLFYVYVFFGQDQLVENLVRPIQSPTYLSDIVKPIDLN